MFSKNACSALETQIRVTSVVGQGVHYMVCLVEDISIPNMHTHGTASSARMPCSRRASHR